MNENSYRVRRRMTAQNAKITLQGVVGEVQYSSSINTISDYIGNHLLAVIPLTHIYGISKLKAILQRRSKMCWFIPQNNQFQRSCAMWIAESCRMISRLLMTSLRRSSVSRIDVLHVNSRWTVNRLPLLRRLVELVAGSSDL